MGLENARDDGSADGRAEPEPVLTERARLDKALLARLDRIVALAGDRAERALHDELLDELRGLLREAEKLRPAPQPAPEGVVERPARRLHGT